MKTVFDYESATVAVKDLTEKGYKIDYNTEFDQLVAEASDYEIDYLYRYEGMTDPGDESSVYGIRNVNTGDKGIFVAGNLSLIEGRKRDIILELEMKARQKHH